MKVGDVAVDDTVRDTLRWRGKLRQGTHRRAARLGVDTTLAGGDTRMSMRRAKMGWKNVSASREVDSEDAKAVDRGSAEPVLVGGGGHRYNAIAMGYEKRKWVERMRWWQLDKREAITVYEVYSENVNYWQEALSHHQHSAADSYFCSLPPASQKLTFPGNNPILTRHRTMASSHP
ncbi:hypothetical protein BDQ17DRAFT_1331020 [Cyathus striatus]|nr:hypothetical protein BDQ17DRAFT_1331020 [Cyathus striatus]